jgi:NitT/TauT family transport system ATP-binding protein
MRTHDAMANYFAQIYQRPVRLELKQLSQVFAGDQGPRTILHQLNLQIHQRELICLIGPSGCGKSTLSRVIAGLDPYHSGELYIDGQAITGPSPSRGMVFQSYTLFPWKTVKHNIMFGPRMTGLSHTQAERLAREWLDVVGLSDYQNLYPHQLSGGMQQRVAIARALVNQPKLLLMDEPFAALDPYTRQKMQKHLLDLWQNIDITIIFVTHDMEEAILLADRIVVLKANPGEIKHILEVPLPRPRQAEMRLLPEFQRLKQHIDALVYSEQLLHHEQELPLPQIPRLRPLDEQTKD